MPLFPVRHDSDSAAFFEGTARDQFLLVHDRSTNEFLDPTTDTSIEPDRYELVPASGVGTVISWSVVHLRGDDGPIRNVVGIVELEEGPWWWTEITGADPDDDLTGVAVSVVFVPSGTGEKDERIPQFQPTGGGPRVSVATGEVLG
ncbi:DUF35 OB-fold domain-containing protein, acyl-CoA-associated [Agreia bicolorata]|uniref:DUF35 OB-fold domain-containing protein, acyl-CoA-associated n=1 Tax=Agreia bicolorata TaxID=110935 RepID=A0A1T4YEA0_9MICO|nr:OB-fold domain-containing protein [Agreia bicolorata]SKB00106.1 DUF35 OB-fold domain-containing protein, acyl-CoA-associated [Agreia bicolorata]